MDLDTTQFVPFPVVMESVDLGNSIPSIVKEENGMAPMFQHVMVTC